MSTDVIIGFNTAFEINKLDEQERSGQGLPVDSEALKEIIAAGGDRASFLAQISPWITSPDHHRYLVPILFDAQDGSSFRELTGGVRAVKALNLTDKAKNHIAVAKKIIAYVQNAVPFCGNYLKRSRVYRLLSNGEPEVKHTIFQAIHEVQKVTLEEEAQIDQIDQITREYKTGNCFELSVVGYKWGVQLPDAPLIEIFAIVDGNHTFLVIGRDPKTDPNNYKSWNKDAIICDSWIGSYYPASWLEKYLFSYESSGASPGEKNVAHVSHFDPSHQQLTRHPLMPTNIIVDEAVDDTFIDSIMAQVIQ
jgi:hypothetical protein